MKGRKPVVQCTEGEWRDMVRRLKACCPPPDGYSWRFSRARSLEKEMNRGTCERHGKAKTILVRVAPGMSESETLDVLIHEMAHGYDMWVHHAWATDHGETFWLWVGRIFRKYWGEG